MVPAKRLEPNMNAREYKRVFHAFQYPTKANEGNGLPAFQIGGLEEFSLRCQKETLLYSHIKRLIHNRWRNSQ
jgi:hypothetical protein